MTSGFVCRLSIVLPGLTDVGFWTDEKLKDDCAYLKLTAVEPGEALVALLPWACAPCIVVTVYEPFWPGRLELAEVVSRRSHRRSGSGEGVVHFG